ncbi:MAG: flagellar export chaperone FlgN [Nitrospinota bacterium]|nr:flagellar export chaperone FlgN [Nitrospinota bacterium]
MAGESIAEKLISAAKADLASYEELLALCGREYASLSTPRLDDLSLIIEEKERFIREIEENSDRHSPLWAEFESAQGGDSAMDRLGEAVDRVREVVEAVQKSEEKIAELVMSRSEEIQGAIGTISQSGKALSAYKPVRNYAPRFVDRKE